MRVRHVFCACVAVSAMHTAFAQGPIGDPDPFTSGRSKADVRAEYAAFRSNGVNPWSTSYNPMRGFQSTRTRAEVRNDYIANRNQVLATTGEDSGSEALRRSRSAG